MSVTKAALKTVMTADDRLDDLKRARIWARLEERIDAEAVVARPRRGLRVTPRMAGGAVGVLAAAAVAAVVLWPNGKQTDHQVALVAPADGMLSANLGPHAHATLVGSTQVTFDGPAGETTAVRLVTGEMYAEFDGGPGRSLTIEAPGALITIVGTRFGVETHGGTTCVSVSHGKVRVDAGGTSRFVEGGESWCTSDGAEPPAKIAPKTRDAIERFTAMRVAVAEDAEAVRDAVPAKIDVPTAHADETAPRLETDARAPQRVDAPSVDAPRVDAPHADAPRHVEADRPRHVDAPHVDAPHVDAPAQVEAPKPTAEQRYEAAEDALAHGDASTADRILAELVTTDPTSSLADEALFERARLAFARQGWADARAHLDALAARHGKTLAEPAHYLRCRVDVESHDRDATACLASYRAAFPKGPHDLDVAGLLVQLAHAAGGCDAARTALDDLARAYPGAPLTRAWLARCPENKK